MQLWKLPSTGVLGTLPPQAHNIQLFGVRALKFDCATPTHVNVWDENNIYSLLSQTCVGNGRVDRDDGADDWKVIVKYASKVGVFACI
jgi:hypothetical protein